MNARTYVRSRCRIRAVSVAALVCLGIVASAKLVHQFCPGGSMITNPDAWASANIAAGLRAARR